MNVTTLAKLLLAFVSVSHAVSTSTPEEKRRSQRGLVYIVSTLCADNVCTPRDTIGEILSCVNTQFVDSWESCVRDTGYAECVPTMTYFTFGCMYSKISDDLLLITPEERDCIEDKITIRTYRCATDAFYQLRYNTSLFTEKQKKIFESYKLPKNHV